MKPTRLNGSTPQTVPHIRIRVFPAANGGAKIELKHQPPITVDRSTPCPPYIAIADRMVKWAENRLDPREIVASVRRLQSQMTGDQRLELWDAIRADWCVRCGGPAPCDCRGKIIAIGQ